MAWDGEAGSSGEYISLARLVRRAQAGERGAFDELYARTAQVQYFALVGKVGREAADDLLQELYLIAWENIASVRPRSFVGYLNATARNLCLRHFKRQGTSKEPTPAEDRALEEIGAECGDVASDGAVVADPSTTVAAQDERARLAHVLREELDAEERDAVLMRYYQNMKLGEIASALDLSRATVKRRLASALEKFREKMGFAPTGVVFAELLARTVEESPAPRLRLAQRMARARRSNDIGRCGSWDWRRWPSPWAGWYSRSRFRGLRNRQNRGPKRPQAFATWRGRADGELRRGRCHHSALQGCIGHGGGLLRRGRWCALRSRARGGSACRGREPMATLIAERHLRVVCRRRVRQPIRGRACRRHHARCVLQAVVARRHDGRCEE